MPSLQFTESVESEMVSALAIPRLCGSCIKEETVIPLNPKETVRLTIGRSRKNDVVIRGDDKVSGEHAVLTWDPESLIWSVQDLQSSKGTHVHWGRDGLKSLLKTDEVFPLPLSCALRFNTRMVTLVPDQFEKLELEFTQGCQSGQRYVIAAKDECTIGRSHDSIIRLKDNEKISGKHLCIKKDENEFVLKDVGSKYGTRVNGQALEEDENFYLFAGCEVAIGKPGDDPSLEDKFVMRVKIKGALGQSKPSVQGGGEAPTNLLLKNSINSWVKSEDKTVLVILGVIVVANIAFLSLLFLDAPKSAFHS